MPIVHMAQNYIEATERGTNVKLYHTQGYVRDEQGNEIRGVEFDFIGYTYETHQGLCIRDGEYNGYDDSDFFMVVWNDLTQQPERIVYASTRGWSYPCYATHVDATPETLAKYKAYENEQERIACEREARRLAMLPAKGKKLKVVKGRKVPKGTTGVCIWYGNTQFGARVGLKDSTGTIHWTAATNVDVQL